MVLCCHFPYHFSGFHTFVLLMGNYYHLSPVCVSCCSSALQQHLMAAIYLVAESSYSRQVAGAGRTRQAAGHRTGSPAHHTAGGGGSSPSTGGLISLGLCSSRNCEVPILIPNSLSNICRIINP